MAQTVVPQRDYAPVIEQGSPDVANSGPASTGTISPNGLGTERGSNNSAGDGNAELTTRGAPNTGKGGGEFGGG
jgi:hypothetical protein